MTLGDCAVEAQRGRRRIKVGTVTEALEHITSSSSAMRKTPAAAGDRDTVFHFQKPRDLRDPILSFVNQSPFLSGMNAGTGGPREEDQCGPCVSSGQGRRIRRCGKLAARFLLGIYDLDAINSKTLAAAPVSVFPSYAHILRTGMAMTGAGGVGNGGAGSDGGGAGGRGFGAGHGGGRTGGGGGARGSRQAYDGRYGYNHYNDDAAPFNGPRFNPNLGAHPPNYGPG